MRERILIIEDEEAIRSILRELLLDAGYEVEEAADGPEGIAKFRAGRFALVLLDLMGARARRLRRLRADTPRLGYPRHHAHRPGRRGRADKGL